MSTLRVELRPFRLALRAPIVIGGIPVRFRAGFLVGISTHGLTGWGEASPLPGWSRTSLHETEAALRGVVDRLDAAGTRDAGTEEMLGDLLAGLDEPHARAAVAGAWADLQAQRAGRTLAAHLAVHRGAAAGVTVAVNALVNAVMPADVERAVRAAAGAGFTAVKLKVGAADPGVDVERVRAARAAAEGGVELRLDANGAWDPMTAIEVLDEVSGCDVAYCEEPAAGLDAIAEVGRHSPVAVAADESVRSESDAVRALDLGIRTLVVKPQALGGPDVALSIAAHARQADASAVVTSFVDSAVGLAHALHVAAAADAAARRRQAHGLATAELLAADVATAPPVVDGAMAVPAAAGLGVAPGVKH